MILDKEIKEWIDSKKVLTKIELAMFIYGDKKRARKATTNPIICKYWDYVLSTKKMKELRLYKELKINNGHRREDADKIRSIIKKDKRFDCGTKRGKKLMLDLYGIAISRHCIGNYIKEQYAPKKIN